MKPERWQKLDRLFHSALERQPEERAAFLDEACAGDQQLRREVEALIAANERNDPDRIYSESESGGAEGHRN